MSARFGDPALPDRFWSKVAQAENGCWEWVASVTSTGYGQFRFDGRVRKTHRLAYLALVGPVPEGLVLDHLCRNRGCCNPAHLEVVTQRENLLRGEGFNAVNAAKTHCIRGHEFTAVNTYWYDDRRHCRACININSRARRAARTLETAS